MSKRQAKFCVFLVNFRKTFLQACTSDEWISDTVKIKALTAREPTFYYFSARTGFKEILGLNFDRIVNWTFGKKVVSTSTLSLDKNLEIIEEISKISFPDNDIYTPILKEIAQIKTSTSNAIKKRFEGNEKILNVLNRLEKGAQELYNPYWIGASKKLEKLYSILDETDETKANELLNDPKSELSKTIDFHRLSFFNFHNKSTASRHIIQDVEVNKPK